MMETKVWAPFVPKMLDLYENKPANIQRNVVQEVGHYLNTHSWDICQVDGGGDFSIDNGQLDPSSSMESFIKILVLVVAYGISLPRHKCSANQLPGA